MVRRRFEEWARAQARWLGAQALSAQAPGTAALVAASLWVVVARVQAGAGPPPEWPAWTPAMWIAVRHHLTHRGVASIGTF
eukprot:6618767-Alexandrium_andersonii.AAC.1